MNLKNLLKHSVLLLFLFALISGFSVTQARTFYVDNVIGSDGYDGFSATVVGGGVGPRATIFSPTGAYEAAVDGDIIVINYTGNNYDATHGEPAAYTVTKQVTFQTTGSTAPILATALTFNPGAGKTVTFNSGAITLTSSIVLQSGVVANTAGLLTLDGSAGGITITRFAYASPVTTSFSNQLSYVSLSKISFIYQGGFAVTTGNEFPAAGGSFLGLQTTGVGTNLTINRAVTVNGQLNTSGTLNLGSNILSFANSAGTQAHVISGDITNGTLSFTLTNDETLTGNYNLPAITVTRSATSSSVTGLKTLTVTATGKVIGDITAKVNGSITLSGVAPTSIASISNQGSGVITVSGATEILGDVTLSGTIVGSVYNATNSYHASGDGRIVFSAATTVDGNVNNNAVINMPYNTAAISNVGVISFADQPQILKKDVNLNAVIQGTTSYSSTGPRFSALASSASINFLGTGNNVTISGVVKNSGQLTATGGSTSSASTTNLNINFATTTGAIIVRGGFLNSSNITSQTYVASITGTGSIFATSRTSGKIGATNDRTGDVINNATTALTTATLGSSAAIDLGYTTATAAVLATDGAFYGKNISNNAYGNGGYIRFGDHIIDITGSITNNRANRYGDIQVANIAATVVHAHVIGGDIINAGSGNIEINLAGADATHGDRISVSGQVKSTATEVSGALAPATASILFTGATNNVGTAATITFGSLSISSGLISVPATHLDNIVIGGDCVVTGGKLSLLGGAPGTISISKNITWTGGTIDFTGRASVTFTGTNNAIGSTSGTGLTFVGTAPLVMGTPSPSTLATLTFGSSNNTTYPGSFTINNATGLANAVTLTGGSFYVAGDLSFANGAVAINGPKIYVRSISGTAFTNTSGYTTTGGSIISLIGAGAQGVSGGGSFGDFEANSTNTITIAAGTGPFTGIFNLTNGTVACATASDPTPDIVFNGAPTLVRNKGTFTHVPTFLTPINVTYIGVDKVAGKELPTDITNLNNLTVATTNGNAAAPGAGTVEIASDVTVNGILTVNTGQALILNGCDLYLNCPTVNLNGDITNVGAGDNVIFERTGGTTVSGAGYLPDVLVATGSANNVINGSKALMTGLLGADHVRGTDDVPTATTAATGSLAFAGGSNNSSIGIAFGSGVKDGTQIFNLTTVAGGGNNVINLTGNLKLTNDLTHAEGTVNVGAYTLEQRGATLSVTDKSIFTGTGKLRLYNTTASGAAQVISVGVGVSTIGTNVEIENVAAAPNNVTSLAGFGLKIAGDLNLITSAASAAKFDVNGLDLTLMGKNLTIGSNYTLIAAGNVGFIKLNSANPPLQVTFSGASASIVNLNVQNDVIFGGSATSPLTITNAFVHEAGNLNFGDRNLIIQNSFTRSGGSYSAGNGFMVLDGAFAAFDQGTGFSIPNLKFSTAAAAVTPVTLNNAAGKGAITVTKKLNFNVLSTLTDVVTTNGLLSVADSVAVTWQAGKTDVSPVYAASINLEANGYTTPATIPAVLWPTTNVNLVRAFTINGAASADVVKLPSDVTVGTNLNLNSGVLDLDGKKLSFLAGIKVLKTDLASILTTTSGSVYNNSNITDYDLTYATTRNTAGGGDITTGVELLSELDTLTITRSANVSNAVVTINSPAIINGALIVRNNLTASAANSANLTVKGNLSISKETSYAAATFPVVSFATGASLTLGGVSGQTLDVPAAATINSLTVNLAGINPILNVTGGGELKVNELTLINGIVNMGTSVLTLPNPNDGGGAFNSGLGFNRDQVTGNNMSHIVGTVKKEANTNDGSVNDGRFVFPVGTLGDQDTPPRYRPVTIIFTPDYPVGSHTYLTVNHVAGNPDGSAGFSNMDNGAGLKIGRYPNFYWLVKSLPSNLSQNQKYDLEMSGTDLDYDDALYADLRGIRRQDGNAATNAWQLLSTDGSSNYQDIQNATTYINVRAQSAKGGLIYAGSRFTIGIPVQAPMFSVPSVSPYTYAPTPAPKEGTAISIPFSVASGTIGTVAPTVTYTLAPAPAAGSVVKDTIVATATGNVLNGNFNWTPGYANAGTYVLTIKATDANGTTNQVINFTVANTNRNPVLAAGDPVVSADPKVGTTTTVTFNVTDPDADAITWTTKSVTPTPAAVTYTNTGSQYVVTITPAVAEVGTVFKVDATFTDANGGTVSGTKTLAAVTMAFKPGDIDKNGIVNAADAQEALRMSVGFTTNAAGTLTYGLTEFALGDVDNNHTAGTVMGAYAVGGYDAYKILWKSLDPANRLLPIEGGPAKSARATGEISLGKAAASATASDVVAVPLNISNSANVNSVTFELSFDAQKAEVVGVTSKLPSDWTTVYSSANGVVKVVMVGVTSISVENLGELNLRIKNREDKVALNGTAIINDQESKTLATMTVGQIPASFDLSQNYPNPFNPSTTIKYAISEPTKVVLSIYNIQGQLVSTLVNESQDAGYHSIVWNGRNNFGQQLASGVYIYRIQAGKFVSQKKLQLMK